MKVWILDDSHFPQDIVTEKIEGKTDTCKRWFLTYRVLDGGGSGEKSLEEIKLR